MGDVLDDSLIKAMKGVVDDLYGHVHRVADLSVAVGKEMRLDPKTSSGFPSLESSTTSARSTSTRPSSPSQDRSTTSNGITCAAIPKSVTP